MLGLLLLGLALLWAFSGLAIRLLCGPAPEFLALAPVVRYFSLAVIPMALYQLVLLYQLAAHTRWALEFEASCTLAYLLLLAYFHSSWNQVIGCLGGVSLLLLAGGLGLSLRPEPKAAVLKRRP